MSQAKLRVMVVGAGETGIQVLQQLQKNPNITVVTVDPNDDPAAVRKGVIERIDIRESLTPLTLEYVLRQAQPDLVILTSTTEDLGLGKAPGLDLLSESLKEELVSIADVPIIEAARAVG